MSDDPATLTLRLDDERADGQELDGTVRRLRRQLLDLDLYDAGGAKHAAPTGSKGVDVAALNAVAVLVCQPEIFAAVVSVMQSWIGGRPERTVEMEVDGDRLHVTGLSDRQQQELIDAWLRRRGGGRS